MNRLLPSITLPETRRALVILNAQDDSSTRESDFLLRINELISYVEHDTDIIRVCDNVDPGRNLHQDGTNGT